MGKLLVSVIVAVYNTEKYLNKCVDSIINQTYKNLEIILVDDGSNDNSPKICDEYTNIDNRIKVVHKKNGGPASSREMGINVLSGDYVLIIDSDDWIDKNLVKECVEKIKNNDIDYVLYSYVKEYGDFSSKVSLLDSSGIYDSNFIVRRIIGEIGSELKQPEKLEIFASTCMKMYRIDVFRKGVPFDLNYVGTCEDGLFNLYALYGCNKCFYINKSYYHYRKHFGETITSSYKNNLYLQWKNLFYEFEKFIKENNLNEDYEKALQNRKAFSMIGLGFNEMRNPNKKQRKKNLKIFLKDDDIQNALKDFDSSILSLNWKIFILFCKHKLITPLYWLLKIMMKLGRKG